MNSHLITPLTLALLAASAHAWPFVLRDAGTGGGSPYYALEQLVPVQTDGDRPPEIFGGGYKFTQLSTDGAGQLVASAVTLPLPDYDPYPDNAPQVTFVRGRGAVGDIDGDGLNDIIYTCSIQYDATFEEEKVRVVACRNNGNGTWTRLWQIKTTTGGLPGRGPAVRLADLDRDGDLDFVETSTGLRVRWNDGTGNHSTSTTLTTDTVFAPGIEVADFDGNGWPDVALFGDVGGINPSYPQFRTGRLTMFWNNAGSFSSQTIHTLDASHFFSRSSSADLNSDGRIDLISVRGRVGGGEELQWHRNNGSGFDAPIPLYTDPAATSEMPLHYHHGDMDEDGVIDIVISRPNKQFQWRRGTGDGAFASPVVLYPGTFLEPTPSVMCVTDADGDGDSDIVFSSGEYWLENQSIRMRPAASSTPWWGANPSGAVKLAVADLDRNGRDDLIVANGGGSNIRTYGGSGSALFAPVTVSTLASAPLGITTGDFNADGRPDIAWSSNNNLTQALRAGDGTWTISTAATMSGISEITAADVDRDGDTDIFSMSPSQNLVRNHLNNGTASSWLPQNVDTGLSSLKRITTGQLIPGGRPELITLSASFVSRYAHQSGAWTAGILANESGSTGSAAVIITDISDNLTGMETIYALNSNAIYYKHENLALAAKLIDTDGPVHQLAAVDWNRDGFTDIIAATATGVLIYPHTRAATPSFGSPVQLLTGTSIQDVVIMNINGDAYPDAVAAQSGTGALHLITNRSAVVEVNATSPGTRTVLPGNTVVDTILNRPHRGMRATELPCAPMSLLFRFRRSTPVGGVDTPGTPLTQSEVSALVDTIALQELDGSPPHFPTSPTGVSDGYFTLEIPAPLRGALMLTNQESNPLHLTVKLKSTAAGSAVQRFYVEHHAADSPWVELDSGLNSNPLPARINATTATVSTLFVVKVPSALENWRMTWFGQYEATGIAANDYDDDGDGLPNLVEYLASRNPRAASGLSELSKPLVMVSGGPGTPVVAEVRILQNFDPKVRVRLQNSTGMQFWSNMAIRDGGSSWVGRTPATTLLSGGRALYSFNTNISPNDEPKYFLRLVAEELP